MEKSLYQFAYEVYDSSEELVESDRELVQLARNATSKAYAPYSHFRVGAAAQMQNGMVVTGGNQENASFPAGICAERVVMSSAAAQFPGLPIVSLAISYIASRGGSDHPISPCGICRQSFQEFQQRTGSAIRLLMAGATGKVFVVEDAAALLPLAFTNEELQ